MALAETARKILPMIEPVRVYFDFIDPLSYLTELALRDLAGSLAGGVERVGFELVPPPHPLTASDDPRWSSRWTVARPLAAASSARLDPPRLVPWTRKAHELHLHAQASGMGDVVRLAIYEAYFGRAEDIGRVDRLVEIAAAHGLDRTATKAVLDVDRYEEDVNAARAAAKAAGVEDVPAIEAAGSLVRGFQNRGDLLTLLRGAK